MRSSNTIARLWGHRRLVITSIRKLVQYYVRPNLANVQVSHEYLVPGANMAEMVGQLRNVNTGRTRALVVPREHGAWGLLLVPLVTGACIGVPHGSHLSGLLWFLTASIALFWLRTPVESWLGTSPMRVQSASERRTVINAAVAIGAIAALSLAGLFWGGRNYGLLVVGAVAGTAFALQGAVKLFGRRMRMAAQMIGAIGLTSTAAGAYYVTTGQLDERAAVVWAANWLFAGDQIHFVQMRLHNSRISGFAEKFSRARTFFLGQFAMLVVVTWVAGLGLVPAFAAIAFVPVVVRGVWWFFQKAEPLQLHWLGITELLHSITFAVLLIASFYVRP